MYKQAFAYATPRQFFLQEAVYHCLHELWLRKCFPKTIYVNTNLPAEQIRMCKSETEINKLDSDSTDVFKRNMADCYIGALCHC